MASSASLTTTHLPHLRAELDEWRKSQPAPAPFATSFTDISARILAPNAGTVRGKDVVVAFRTRPSLEHEAEEKFHAYEGKEEPAAKDVEQGDVKEGENAFGDAPKVEFCPGISLAQAEPGKFVAHVPGFKWSGPTLAHKAYEADIAFGPDVDNEEVYQRTVVANDLIRLSLSHGIACILAYGQTGSGKTYTMEALEQRVARDLFATAKRSGAEWLRAERKAHPKAGSNAEEVHEDNGASIYEFSVTFLELLGRRAVDLLEPDEGLPLDAQGSPIRSEIPVGEDKNGDVRPRLISREVKSSAELQELITTALSHRRTSATARNATSSRSHALLNIRIKNKMLPYAEEGQLILVDLAGSERYEDSKAHDRQRMLESRENNNSLMNLKECVRAKARMANEDGFVHIPWRSNKLTMLLKPLFDIESRQLSRTLIIAHVSPHLQDSTHSVNTLSYASPFKTIPPKPRGPAPFDPADPRTWNHEQTLKWLTDEFTKRAKTRAAAAHKVAVRDAGNRGKKLGSVPNDEPVQLVVDIEKVCPEGMTAKNIGAMYTTDFVQLCVQHGRFSKEVTTNVVMNAAAEVVGQLYYLILTAKSKLRKQLMKSRKTLEADAIYGVAPNELIPGTSIMMPNLTDPKHPAYILRAYKYEDFKHVEGALSTTWYEAINAAAKKARDEGNMSVEEAEVQEMARLMGLVFGSRSQQAEAGEEGKK